MKQPIHINSLCVHEAEDPRTTQPHILPIYPTASYVFENIEQGIDIFSGKREGHVYSRYGNPTVEAVANKLAQMEVHGSELEASAIMLSSGMAAFTTLFMALLKSGDKILSQANIYGGTTELLGAFAKLEIETIWTDLTDPEAVEQALKEHPSIRLLLVESPANPAMQCADIALLSELAHRYEAFCAVDNTFATALLQQPLSLGADFALYSTTKYLNGHGNSIAGAIIGRDTELMQKKVWKAMCLNGSNASPWEAWLTGNGLKTLPLRICQHSDNAMTIARFLEQHPAVERVNYPGLPSHPQHEIAKKQMKAYGGMLSFELKGGLQAGIRWMNALQFIKLVPTLGEVDTMALHPASMSHRNIPKPLREQNGITDGLIRLSTGIENVDDILRDVERGLNHSTLSPTN